LWENPAKFLEGEKTAGKLGGNTTETQRFPQTLRGKRGPNGKKGENHFFQKGNSERSGEKIWKGEFHKKHWAVITQKRFL